jgi:hypothetical protein
VIIKEIDDEEDDRDILVVKQERGIYSNTINLEETHPNYGSIVETH